MTDAPNNDTDLRDKQYKIAQIFTAIGFGGVALVLFVLWREPVAKWLALGIAGFGVLQIMLFQLLRSGVSVTGQGRVKRDEP
ncbi:hypothetical protein [Fretibacter rubidus]|uniref:hypothetical protein n=1 Tax=Fretibacter rubidus TaxID=570162 RepID=UPI00352A579C